MERKNKSRKMKTLAVVRVRGKAKNPKIKDTLRMLNLKAPNHCTVVSATPQFEGMIEKCMDWITYGEIRKEVLTDLIKERGETKKGKVVDDQWIKENSEFESIEDFSEAILKGEATLKDVEGLRKRFRLNPPSQGWEDIKNSYPEGSLGYRGEEINRLLRRMI